MASFLPGIAQCTVNNFNDFFFYETFFFVKKHWGELFDCIKRLLVFRGDNLLRLVMVMMAFCLNILFAEHNRMQSKGILLPKLF